MKKDPAVQSPKQHKKRHRWGGLCLKFSEIIFHDLRLAVSAFYTFFKICIYMNQFPASLRRQSFSFCFIWQKPNYPSIDPFSILNGYHVYKVPIKFHDIIKQPP